ncbi:hypothetical protein BT93_C0262 [Corymbia citriodora subsp. variegata]|nr:hypothetical protein BT93_C0262 [Corymbia citriodora subsp. variegata]
MECKESRGQIVLPVLYQVKTKDVKYLKGSVKEAFESRRYWSDEAVKQQGTEALRKAAECRVYESENFAGGQEAELVDELVATVMRQQQDDFRPYLHENLVGNDDDVAEVMRLVDTAHPNTRIIGIYGISGIGKTTLATIIYTKLFDKFDCRSFIRDVGETIKKNGIGHVQSRLISDLLNIPKYQVPDSDIGIKMIQTNCTQKKVLILLDDVSHQDHVNKLIGNGRFMPGSRIIITCRDEATLKSEYHKYKCKELNITNSSLLFNIHAFEGKPPPTELASLSSEIIATTGGLPLALIVIGSLLKRTKDPKVWEEYRDKWRKAPEREVMDKLKISYNTLEESTKQIFLDIACFFIGIDHRIATYLWSYLDLYPRSGLQKMVELSLISFDDNNELRMHDQLRDLGRAIAHTADKKPCSRLWDKEATTILRSKEGNENIKALRLDENGSTQFLHVSVMEFTGDFEKTFSELRWLKWERCPDSLTVTDVHLEKLLILDLSSSNINENWEGWSSIKISGLKVLNLSGCIDLNRTPDLSAFKSLERLILENCENLEEIDPSIGNLKHLVSLNLRHCGSLKELPEQLGKLIKLEELLLDETDTQEIPTFIGSLEKLTTLSAVCCCLLTRVPSSISSLVSLSTLNLSTCKKLQELPDSFKALGQLERLMLARCYALKQIPSSIGKLKMLEELDLSSTRIRELPESIEKLDKLKILRISHSQIERLPSSIGKLQSLREFDASGCHRLRGQILVDEVGLSSLMTLRLGQAKISHLPENFSDLSALDHVDLLYCTELQSLPEPPFSLSSLQLTCRSDKLPSLAHLGHLKKLTVHSCMSLQSVPELPSCIQKLRVCKCPGLERLSNLPNLKSLLELEILQCYGLKELDGLEALESLRKLDVSMSTELSNLNDFEDLESLRYSDMQCYDGEADYLREIPGLGQLKSLEVLNISARKKIRQLDLSKSEHLRQLIVNNCQSLVKIQFHDKIESLERFDRDGCQPQITRLFGT